MESVQTHGIDPQTVRANKLDLVERLADDLAHEIKNPLHSMVINLEVLKRRIARSAASDQGDLMRYVGVLAGELDRVNRRVELLLRMVRPDRGGEPASLASVLDELLELVELERERLGVSVQIDPSPQVLRGRAPHDAARQAVLNLLLVAMESAGSGGSVRVSVEVRGSQERLRLRAASPPEGVRDQIATDGVEECEARLATVRTLAAPFGGHLEVESRSGTARETELLFSVSIDGS